MPLPVGPIGILPLAAALVILMSGSGGAFAQNVGPNESGGNESGGLAGRTVQSPLLTPSQKSALYHAALLQRGHSSAMQINPTVGASVSRSVELSSLPDRAGIDATMDLKYAMVEGDVVVIDPVQMRVVDIIHGSTRP